MRKIRQFAFAALVSVAHLAPATYTYAAQGSDAAAAVGDGQSVTESQNKSMGNSSAAECIVQGESGGNQFAVNNSSHAYGLFQITEGKLVDLEYAVNVGTKAGNNDGNVQWSAKAQAEGINSWQDFLANADFQRKVKGEIDNLVDGRINSTAKSLIGSSIDCNGTPTTLTAAMLTQGAQFGEGKVNKWAAGGGTCVDGKNSSTNDGNNKCVTWQMCHAANCSNVTKDMSKQTCSVVMPMIKQISCSNYTGANLALCNAAKPYLMTDGECAAAEAMAKEAPKGPNKEKCENLTFGPGTGSWSFALACSYASEAVADQDGSANSTTPTTPDDPQCIAKLQSMGIQFTGNGSPRQNGTNGGDTCVVQSSVQSRGTAVPFGVNLEMDCNMLYAFETFGQKLKAIGVTGYYGMGSTSDCRRIRNNKTSAGKNMSWHAYGKAVDFSGVLVGGKKISMGLVNEPGTAAGQFALQIKSIACSTFSGVLTPTWENYKGDYFHNHVDIGGKYCK
jgi:hypothetical protein